MAQLPVTSLSLLSRLRDEGNQAAWEVSWRQFIELYHLPLIATAAAIYRSHTGNVVPSAAFLEDTVSKVITDFLTKNRFDPNRGRLRNYLRVLTNARIVDALRKERIFAHLPLDDNEGAPELRVPSETPSEKQSFESALLNTIIQDLRGQIPLRHFEIFEMAKLKNIPPKEVAEALGIGRNVVDNTVHKVMKRLREISTRPEYKDEYYQ